MMYLKCYKCNKGAIYYFDPKLRSLDLTADLRRIDKLEEKFGSFLKNHPHCLFCEEHYIYEYLSG